MRRRTITFFKAPKRSENLGSCDHAEFLIANVKRAEMLQGFADGLLQNLEHTSSKMSAYQRIRQVDLLLCQLNSPENPA